MSDAWFVPVSSRSIGIGLRPLSWWNMVRWCQTLDSYSTSTWCRSKGNGNLRTLRASTPQTASVIDTSRMPKKTCPQMPGLCVNFKQCPGTISKNEIAWIRADWTSCSCQHGAAKIIHDSMILSFFGARVFRREKFVSQFYGVVLTCWLQNLSLILRSGQLGQLTDLTACWPLQSSHLKMSGGWVGGASQASQWIYL